MFSYLLCVKAFQEPLQRFLLTQVWDSFKLRHEHKTIWEMPLKRKAYGYEGYESGQAADTIVIDCGRLNDYFTDIS